MKVNIKIKLFILAIAVIYIILMYINVNGIMAQVKNAFYNTDCYISAYEYGVIEKNPEVNYIIYDESKFNQDINIHFNIASYYPEGDFSKCKINLKINSVFTIHDFFDGYIWFHYTLEVFDENGNSLTGAGATPVKMKIHRENGKWMVVQIWEKP